MSTTRFEDRSGALVSGPGARVRDRQRFEDDMDELCLPLLDDCTDLQRQVNAAEVKQFDALHALFDGTRRISRRHAVGAGRRPGEPSATRRFEWDLAAVQADCAVRLGLSEATVARMMDLAWRLSGPLAVTRSAWLAGTVTRRHVEVIDRATLGLTDSELDQMQRELLARSPAEL